MISGAITLGVGALLLALGLWAVADDAAVEQAGAGIQFTPPAVDASLQAGVAPAPQ